MKGQCKGLLAIFAAATVWGLGGPYFRWVDGQGVGIFVHNAICGLTAAPVLYVLARARGRSLSIAPRRLLALVPLAVATIVTNYTMFHAFRITTVANTVLLHYMTPVFVAMIAVPLFGERLTRLKVAALFCSMAGMLLVVAGRDGLEITVGRGEVLAFVSSLSYTVSIVAGRCLRGVEADVSTFWHNVLLTGLCAALAAPGFAAPSAPVAGMIAVMGGIVGSLCTVMAYFYALRHADASRVSIVALMEVVVGAVIGIAFLGEPGTWNVLLGGAMILGGCVIVATGK